MKRNVLIIGGVLIGGLILISSTGKSQEGETTIRTLSGGAVTPQQTYLAGESSKQATGTTTYNINLEAPAFESGFNSETSQSKETPEDNADAERLYSPAYSTPEDKPSDTSILPRALQPQTFSEFREEKQQTNQQKLFSALNLSPMGISRWL